MYQAVQKSWEDEPHPWRAVCAERCMHGSERGNWILADYLLYLIGRWFDPSWAHLQLVVPRPTHVLFLSVLRWFQSKMRPGSAYIINWNQIDFAKLRTINGKVVALSPIVPPVPLFSRNVVVSRIELENCSILILSKKKCTHPYDLMTQPGAYSTNMLCSLSMGCSSQGAKIVCSNDV
jgi:hypothetical protein